MARHTAAAELLVEAPLLYFVPPANGGDYARQERVVSGADSSATIQGQQSPVQTFRSGRELLTIDASVRASDGKPIIDLQPSDFTVRIDGQPREVVAARLYVPPSPAASADANASLPFSRFARVVDNPPGRVVVIAIDRTSIRAGSELATLQAAREHQAPTTPAADTTDPIIASAT